MDFDPTNTPTMDSSLAWMAGLPKFAPAPPPTSSTGFLPTLGSALGAGTLEAVGNVARSVQGGWQAAGFPTLAGYAKTVADINTRGAQAVGNPDLENKGMFSSLPSFGYHVAKSIPGVAAMIGGAAAAPETLLGGVVGAGVAGFPQMFGSNVQSEEQSGPLTQKGAIRAAALAAPESAAMGFMPKTLRDIVGGGVEGGLIKRMFTAGGAAAAQQAGASAAVQAAQDAVYNPELSASDRAGNIVDAALSGGSMGLIFGGALGAVRPARIAPGGVGVADQPIADIVDKAMQPAPMLQLPAPAPRQITDQRMIAVNAAGEASRDAAEVTPSNPGVKQLPNPGEPLQITHQPSTGFSGEPLPITVNAAGEASANADAVRPANPIPMGTPEAAAAVQARAAAAAFMDKTLEGMNKRSAAIIRNDPLFANVADEPDLINAIKARVAVYDEADKSLPKGLEALVDKFATDKETAEHVKRAADLTAVAPALPEAAKALPEAQQLADWHTEADARKGADHALQEPSAESVGSRESPGVGGGVGEGNTSGATAGARLETSTRAPAEIDRNQQTGEGGTSAAVKAGLTPNILPEAQKMAPQWAQDAAKGSQGEVVYSHLDGEHVVTRSIDPWGEPTYKMLARTGAIPDDKTVSALQSAITQDKIQDKFNAQKYQGPFAGKTESVVGTKNVPPENVGLVSSWLRQVGMGSTKVALIHPLDAQGVAGAQEGLNGPYQSARRSAFVNGAGVMNSMGPGRNEFFMSTDPQLSPEGTVSALGHETGHVVERTAWANAAPEVKRPVNDAFQKAYAAAQGLPLQDVVKLSRLRGLGDVDTSNMTRDQQAEFRSYATSFSEWFADNVSKYLTSANEPLDTVGKFFHGVAQKIRQLAQAITGQQFLPDAAVAKFMDDMRESASTNPDMWSNELTRGRSSDKVPVGNLAQEKRNPIQQDDDTHSAIAQVGGLWQRVQQSAAYLGAKLYKASMSGQDLNGMVRLAPDHMQPPLQEYGDSHRSEMASGDALNLVTSKAAAPFQALSKENQEKVDHALLAMRNKWDLDGRKPWAFYKQYHNEPNSAELMALHGKLKSEMDSLRTTGLMPALESMLRMHQIQGYAGNVANGQILVDRLAKTPSALMPPDYVNAHDRFANPRKYGLDPLMQDDPVRALAFWKGEDAAMRAALDARVTSTEAASAALTGAQKSQANDSVAMERAMLRQMNDRTAQIDKGNYSPLGHGKGDYFASGRIALGDDKRMDPKAATAVQDLLDKAGFKDVRMILDSDSNTVFARVGDAATKDRLASVFKAAEAQGHMIPGEGNSGNVRAINVKRDLGSPQIKAMGQAIQDMVDHMGLSDEDGAAIRGRLMSNYFDTLGDHSLIPNQSKAAYISGVEPNMGKVGIENAVNASRASSMLAFAGRKADALASMRQADTDAKSNASGIQPQQVDRGTIAGNEIARREREAEYSIPPGIADKIVAINHTIGVGFSPSYTILPVSQIETLLHPELAKKFGFAKSGLAIGGETGMAFKILGAVLRSDDRFNVTFRESTLRAAGIPERYIDATMRLANSGGLNSFTQYMAGTHEGGLRGKFMHMANAMGTYSEMVPRLVADFAARRLYDDASRTNPNFAIKDRFGNAVSKDDYAHSVVTNSQFNWGAGEGSRLLSNKGPAGPATKIMGAFMNYRQRMLVKLYTETHDLFSGALGGPSVSPAERLEAGKFLAGHLAVATILAGTLGLPGAGFMAGLYNQVAAKWTGRDDINIEGSYRHWLATVFGKDIGEIVAKGAPREAGIDMSKLGDANLLPGTSLILDQRKLEDAEKDWLKTMSGAPINVMMGLALGARDVMNGDYLLGMTKMLPEGFKGLAEAAYLNEHGYVDKYGVQEPMQPNARDILAAAVGIDPANLAHYNEQRRIEQNELAQREYRSQNIERHLVLGANQGTNLQPWINAASQFTMEHPGLGSPLEGMTRAIQSHMLQGIQARSLGLPIGVKPIDLGLIRTTQF